MKTAEDVAKELINATAHSLQKTIPYDAMFPVCVDYMKKFEKDIRKDQK